MLIGSIYGVANAAVSEIAKPVPATVTLVSALPGDANEDGEFNALDITKVERTIVGLDVPTAGADANQDGYFNALDITKVERIIAGMD